MKKLLIAFAITASTNSKAQITLDVTLDSANLVYFFNPVQISSTETKYFWADTIANTFTLYNLDLTPFLSNVAVPEPFIKYLNPGVAIFRAIYVTRTLFDCDSSNIEYAYEAATNGYQTFYIMRTDGTELFRLDSANGPYCFGDCLGGADWIKPIINTSEGAKMFLQRPGPGNINIYSLCGSLPLETFDFTTTPSQYVHVFPSPASNSLTFEIHQPSNMNEEYELVVVDNNAREIKREKINGRNQIILDTHDFNNGNYIYSLCTKTKSYQTGKFIITK
jgi:hypothetical protein